MRAKIHLCYQSALLKCVDDVGALNNLNTWGQTSTGRCIACTSACMLDASVGLRSAQGI